MSIQHTKNNKLYKCNGVKNIGKYMFKNQFKMENKISKVQFMLQGDRNIKVEEGLERDERRAVSGSDGNDTNSSKTE